MRDRIHLTTWLDRTSETRFGVIAKARGLFESALLRRLVEATLRATDTTDTSTPASILPLASSGRISVRLRTRAKREDNGLQLPCLQVMFRDIFGGSARHL